MSKMLITREMIVEFNQILADEDSIVRLEKSPDTQAVYIRLVYDTYLIHLNGVGYSLQPSKVFYQKLSDFFEIKGITNLIFNNTREAFWAFGDN